MSGGRLLLVDDEPQILRALTPALTAGGFEVDTAATGEAAISKMAADPFDVLILDLGLPDMDGKAVIARIREWSDAPIIVLSARDLESEKIDALDLGADDFVNKPVGVGELLARIRAGLRGRERRFTSQAVFRAGDLEVDFAARRVRIEGEDVRLTPREYDLLRTLARHAGRVVTHRQVISAVWGPGAQVDAQFVRVLVGQLRQKVEVEPSSPRNVLTEPGVGYRLRSDD
ncbi:MAG: response regulator transcription factor [Alphaproteobacteria bacterium]|nr:response regulator transcription factor [Alphaproteobacteria bacterium]MBU1513838.1 response regulator transcription factor [Alphaproteobacteria bacterium]MBU2094517.1 response regulator transcription factor [Alphaproteobacteria bacterium]MBU2151222.1 response regulator transcription factor [Alphaproteobacteria bacterium]MBU2310037.1 response regulator transcription factor [Alphaproteobacteria bacterium]